MTWRLPMSDAVYYLVAACVVDDGRRQGSVEATATGDTTRSVLNLWRGREGGGRTIVYSFSMFVL